MKAITILILLAIITLASAEIDYARVKKHADKLISACDRSSEPEVAAQLEEMAALMPDDVTFYGMGISVGQRNDLVFVRTPTLYGTKYAIPLNPARRTNEDCLYINKAYAGNIVFVTEFPAEITTCEYSYYTEKTTYLPFLPVFAESETIYTSLNFKKGSTEGFNHAYAKNTAIKPGKHAIAAEADKVNIKTSSNSENNWILAGTVIKLQYGGVSVKYFHVSQALKVGSNYLEPTISTPHTPTAELRAALEKVAKSADIELPGNSI